MRIGYPINDKPLFECPAISVRKYELGNDSISTAQHKFFHEWAKVFTGYGKGQYIFFFAEHVESLRLKRTSFQDQFFCLFTIRFRRHYLFRRGDETFGLPDDEKALNQILAWFRTHHIEADTSTLFAI